MLSSRIGRRASSNVPAPQPPHGSARNSSHACVHHVQRWFELTSATRPAPVVTCTAGGLRKSSHARPRSTVSENGQDGDRRGDSAGCEERTADAAPDRIGRGETREPKGGDEDAGRADEEEHAEDGAVRLALRVQGARLGDDRAEERPRGDRDGRDARERERARRFEPRPPDDEPHGERRERGEHAAARGGEGEGDEREEEQRGGARAHTDRMLAPRSEPQPQRERRGKQQRKAVPVLDRRLQAGAAVGVGPERGDDRAEERPDDDHAEQRRERRCDRPHRACRGNGEPAEQEEREEDRAAVEELPGAGGLDRPEHGDSLPDDERGEGADQHERLRPRPRGREDAAQDRDPERAERRERRQSHPRESDGTRAAARENRERDRDERDERQRREPGRAATAVAAPDPSIPARIERRR